MYKYSTLTPDVLDILQHKGTEAPGSGRFITLATAGSYLCRGCGLALFDASDQFDSHCGWPSFDDCIKDHVKHQPDADGRRTEILCCQCGGHLGHVFHGEAITHKNTRYCVNSLALDKINHNDIKQAQEAIIAAGCFWGVEQAFIEKNGVIATEVGYSGGKTSYPSYQQVCHSNSGHLETVRILFDPDSVDYREILTYFFRIHDASQINRQGVDVGTQYQSAIFYLNETQQNIAKELIAKLKKDGQTVNTKLIKATTFWPAEDYHQHYLQKKQYGR